MLCLPNIISQLVRPRRVGVLWIHNEIIFAWTKSVCFYEFCLIPCARCFLCTHMPAVDRCQAKRAGSAMPNSQLSILNHRARVGWFISTSCVSFANTLSLPLSLSAWYNRQLFSPSHTHNLTMSKSGVWNHARLRSKEKTTAPSRLWGHVA